MHTVTKTANIANGSRPCFQVHICHHSEAGDLCKSSIDNDDFKTMPTETVIGSDTRGWLQLHHSSNYNAINISVHVRKYVHSRSVRQVIPLLPVMLPLRSNPIPTNLGSVRTPGSGRIKNLGS